jgi:shikimate kinase
VARVGDGSGRPLLAGGPGTASERVADLARSRAPLYVEVADVVVDVDGRSAAEVAEEVLAAVRAHGGGRT